MRPVAILFGLTLLAGACSSLEPATDPTPPVSTVPRIELIEAARVGDAETVRTLLAYGHDPDYISDGNHSSPLIAAADKGHVEVLKMLIDAGAVPTRRSGEMEPILAAALGGHVEAIRLLLEAGADPNALGYDHGASLLHLVVAAECADCVDVLLEAGADTSSTYRTWTPLEAAAFNGWVAGIELLAEAGAQPTPWALYLAVSEDQVDALATLVELGVDPEAPNPRPQILPGGTPIETAARLGASDSEGWLAEHS